MTRTSDTRRVGAAPDLAQPTTRPGLEVLDEVECLRLVAAGGVGRIAYAGRHGLTVIPVNYVLTGGSVVFRTAQQSPLGEDLRTGIAGADYEVAFEVDEFDTSARMGWSVLINGPAHAMTSPDERAAAAACGVTPWPAGERDHAVQVTPRRVTGRRLRGAV